MKLTAYDKPINPSPRRGPKPDTMTLLECKALTEDAIAAVGSIKRLALELDVTEGAPGNWRHGRCRPSRKYRQRMIELIEEAR